MVGLSAQELQELRDNELEAIKAIFGDDYIETHTTTAWGSVNAVHEFTLRIYPNEDYLKKSVGITLHMKIPNTYPNSPPIIQFKDHFGLSKDSVAALNRKVHRITESLRGREMILEIAQIAAEHMTDHHHVAHLSTSLNEEMETRTEELQKEERRRHNEENAKIRQRNALEQEELAAKIQAEKYQKEKTFQSYQMDSQSRITSTMSNSSKTSTDTLSHGLERFDRGLRDRSGSIFYSVTCTSETYHSQFGPYYKARRSDSRSTDNDLIIQTVLMKGPFFTSVSGKRKLHVFRDEIEKLSLVRHENLVQFHGTDFLFRDQRAGQRIALVFELPLTTNLRELLNFSGELRSDKALQILQQVARGLEALHKHHYTHRNLKPENIQLSFDSNNSLHSMVKLEGAEWQRRLLDLNMSNRFMDVDEEILPLSWICPSIRDNRFSYTSARDMWDAGVVLCQMICGLDVYNTFQSPEHMLASLESSTNSAVTVIQDLLTISDKRRLTASQLVSQISSLVKSTPIVSKQPKFNGGNTIKPSPPSITHAFSSSKDKQEINITDEQKGYFWQPRGQDATSRYKSDFDEVEFLGKGGFGQVVKAKNKLDGNFYAIKKIKLPSNLSAEEKILREVTIWSRMSHPNIVRYQTSWVETDSQSVDAREALGALTESTGAGKEVAKGKRRMANSISQYSSNRLWSRPRSADNSDDDTSSEEDSTEEASTPSLSDPFSFSLGSLDVEDLDDFLSTGQQSRSKSYAQIHFGNEDSISRAVSNSDLASSMTPTKSNEDVVSDDKVVEKRPPRTLYIQMEYIEGHTLRTAIEEGLSDSDCWRLFRQILSAMLHFTSINIIHRDLKPTNVFLDSDNRHMRIGDFGLAVEQGAVEMTDGSGQLSLDAPQADLTSNVGTTLYLAPEVLCKNKNSKNGVRYTDKIDMYSLGIVFFEMWHPMETAMERYETILNLRKPEIIFPSTWNASQMALQTEIIKRLLCHDPATRASPADILESDLLPALEIDDAFQKCVREISRPNSSYRQKLIDALMSQKSDQIHKMFTHHSTDIKSDPYAETVCKRLRRMFERRGAIKLESSLLLPAYEGSYGPRLLDHEGTILQLPSDLTFPFARQVSQDSKLHRLKSYNIATVYRDVTGFHPKTILAASYGIVSQHKVLAAEAETMQVMDELISEFRLYEGYVHIMNHSGIVNLILSKLPEDTTNEFIEVFKQSSRMSWDKCSAGVADRTGVPQRFVDLLGTLATQFDIESARTKLEETFPNDLDEIRAAWKECKEVASHACSLGTKRKIFLAPLFVISPQTYDGVYFRTCIFGRKKHVLAEGGRIDQLVERLSPPNSLQTAPHVVECTASLDMLIQAHAEEQESISRVTMYAKREEERSYGPDMPRRCDVYVVSFGTGLLEARLEVVRDLWKSGIRADLMYDRDWSNMSPEEVTSTCRQEGILWLVIVKAHHLSGEQMLKVRGVLRGGEAEVSRHDLVGFLQEKLQEQTRIDLTLFGDRTTRKTSNTGHLPSSSESPFLPKAEDFHIVPFHDGQTRGKTRHILWEKMHEAISKVEKIPAVAVDLDGEAFKRLTETSAWIHGDDAVLRRVCEVVPQKKNYIMNDVRKIVRKAIESQRGSRWVWLYSMGEARPFLLSLNV